MSDHPESTLEDYLTVEVYHDPKSQDVEVYPKPSECLAYELAEIILTRWNDLSPNQKANDYDDDIYKFWDAVAAHLKIIPTLRG